MSLVDAARELLRVTGVPVSSEELSDARTAVEAALWEAEQSSPQVAVQETPADVAPVVDVPAVVAEDPPVAASSDGSSEPQTVSSTETEPPATA